MQKKLRAVPLNQKKIGNKYAFYYKNIIDFWNIVFERSG